MSLRRSHLSDPADNRDSKPAVLESPATSLRPTARGKFLFVNGAKFFVRGVTYGTFRPDAEGHEFPGREVVERDFAMMADVGINAVRTYTPAPRWLLDAALGHGLRVMVGLPSERSAAFFDYRKCAKSIEAMVRAEVRARAGHPAVLCYTIGNEIPASVIRWHGRRKAELFIERLFAAAKEEDPQGLVTYVNYPSTEYLQLPFLDLLAFNVYLESRQRFEAYVARLLNISDGRPLLMAEIGLDSLRHGENAQAETIGWQIRSIFRAGCAGAFVYSWTDEWHRGGGEVHDWKFGATDRERRPKRALAAVRQAYLQAPFPPGTAWPRISVVVCSYNGSRTIRECCQGLAGLTYPDYEVIVVDDGSTDGTGDIPAEYGFRVIRTTNHGLSSARNTGLGAATGDIVAYIDDDAYPDPHWLHYLALTFLEPSSTRHAGVGGPNLSPPGDGLVADSVARAPGGPSHVLLSDSTAEHIPGCNMAFRRSRLLAIGGFDPQFRTAGDDVDVCWRLQAKGFTLGFSPSAVVWHHRRNSIRAYLRQQRGYGRAEAMLEHKWPEKYNAAGHLTWNGRIYGSSLPMPGRRIGRIYHGVWGLAPFQTLYHPQPTLVGSLPLMSDWYLVIAGLTLVAALGWLWPPLYFFGLLAGLSVVASIVQAARCSARVTLSDRSRSRAGRFRAHLLTTCLILLQPLARLAGRLPHGLTLWRRRCKSGFLVPKIWTADIWSRRPMEGADWLLKIEEAVRSQAAVPRRGCDFDRWDLEVGGGIFGAARLSMAAEPHGDGRQLLRFKCWPHCSRLPLFLVLPFLVLSVLAASDGSAPFTWLILSAIALLPALRTILECSSSSSAFLSALSRIQHEEDCDEND
ncbi:MAG TPA: glycosyltransferase [Candidatus Polarisedimenticolia bacterium]|nr:glycosyltransferase [Candidatus Polarisedimenticolia bacterium]